MIWSVQQAAALDQVAAWLRASSKPQVFRLLGYAGTGKTTLAIHIRNMAREIKGGDVMFAAYTGKAAQVMQSKGCEGASTIHKLIYKNTAKPGQDPVWERDRESALKYASLLIVDECSMLGPDLGEDLVRFGVPILVLGDPFQLPPISGQGFFDTATPEVMLTEIHRQAQDNPIIRMSMQIRELGSIPLGKYGESQVRQKNTLPPDAAVRADQVICGTNRTRWMMNGQMRTAKGFTADLPEKGEKIICLRNNAKVGVLNGGMWTVDTSRHHGRKLGMHLYSMDLEGLQIQVDAHKEFFRHMAPKMESWQLREAQQFTWGYAITCHKSQGSQWKNVLVFDESRAFKEDAARWLYTAVTRAADNVVVAV